MTPTEHEHVFFEFVRNSAFSHVSCLDKPLKKQELIGLLVDDLESDGYSPSQLEFIENLKTASVVIDPDYDQVYSNFIKLDYNLESIDYIRGIVESEKSREELSEIIIELLLKKFIDSNINAKKVYFVIYPQWRTDWLDKVIEVN